MRLYILKCSAHRSAAMNVAIALLLAWFAYLPTVDSCYNNKRVAFCPKSGYLHEQKCKGVNPIKCKPWSLLCSCTRKAMRREDGECITSSEDCEKAKRTLARQPTRKGGKGVADSPREIPDSPTELPTTTPTPKPKDASPPIIPNYPLYYSGDSHGCPSDIQECQTFCSKLEFPYSKCDRYLTSDCYCYGLLWNTERKSPAEEKVINEVAWPYGKVLTNGDLIQELKESYGCPENENECFEECQTRGVDGAFCGVEAPYHCFCEAYLPSSDWGYGEEETYEKEVTGMSSCSDRGLCYTFCITQRHSGGFCKGEPSECHCYLMYPYNRPRALQIENELRKLQSSNYKVQVEQILGSRQKLLLLRISSNAWQAVECRCMESDYVQALSSFERSVTCYGLSYSTADELRWHETKENVKYEVKFDNHGTTIVLKTDSQTLPFGFHRTYSILSATPTCMVTQILQRTLGKPTCALWGLEHAYRNDESPCFDKMKEMCMGPFTDTFTQRDECSRQQVGGTYENISKSVQGTT
uniref:Putative tick defensins 1 n=1 Tax=Amblyomma triste TaxID=251400 RepID=A0A023G663_AMBTT